MFTRKIVPLALMSVYGLSLSVSAEETTAPSTEKITITAPVVVTATRIEQNSFDLPVSIDSIDSEKIRDGQLQANISESLVRIPGIVAQSRGQYAQDIQISSRGFGARSQFGVRGIRLYADGIPLTMPDGQGQAGTFDLGSAKSIEVMRGPFSALYGNSSGGVVQIFTEDGPPDLTLGGSFTAGSYGTQRSSVKVGGTIQEFNYTANYSHLESDGYRDHSAVRRDLFNAKLGIQLNEDNHLTVILTDLDQPVSQDPLGLTKAQWSSNPKQAVANATIFNTRVQKSQTHLGIKLDHIIDEDNTISVIAYGGERKNTQYLPTAISAQAAAGSSGGLSKINRDFVGIDLRYVHKGQLADRPYNVAIGTNFDSMTDERTGYNNFVGGNTCGVNATCGVQGTLRRNESDNARNFDQYIQGQWSPLERFDVIAGARHSTVDISSNDHYLSNGNDSGSVTFQKTTSVIGAIFKVTPAFNLYANAGKGFETPTLIEMAYNPSLAPGLNFGLKPSTSNNYEIGAKTFLGDNTRANIAIFKTDTENEIVTATNSGGRTTYKNATTTSRNGFEASVDSTLNYGFTAYAAYTYIDAKYNDAFRTCTGNAACTVGNTTIPSGNYIPGIYGQSLYTEVAWKYAPTNFSTAFELRANSKMYVNDLNSEHTPGYTLLNWRGGFSQKIQQWKFSEFVRVENIFDRNYVGSVRINDANNQYYESGAGRNWLVGLNANYAF